MEQDFRLVVQAPDSPARLSPNRQPDAIAFRLMKCDPRTVSAQNTYSALEQAAHRKIRHGVAGRGLQLDSPLSDGGRVFG